MAIRYLVNGDGSPFSSPEIHTLRKALDSLRDDQREEYRNRNASAIAEHGAVKFLIVSGPGTGKSHLFMHKIDYWYQNDEDARVFVTSFVRKLVADLQSDIESDERLTDGQRGKIMASTLHKFARSIVEKNRGTTEWPFRPHFRVIGQLWKEVVWDDVLAFYPAIDHSFYSWKKFEKQLHDDDVFEKSNEWGKLRGTYFELCQFYNAAGFADLILRATKALAENPDLSEYHYFIVDEYQDFNLAEEALINRLVGNPKGLLVVGDDEQVLYEKLKSGKPTLIRNLYNNKDYANGMLPFCGRSSFHITKTADYFIQQHRAGDCIEKIYLPLKTIGTDTKVQGIGCATSATAVDYIEKFIADNRTEIDQRKRQLEASESKDAFLLILTPAKGVDFYGASTEKVRKIASEYQPVTRSFSEDYYQLLSYYSLAKSPRNNFTFRKVLRYERVADDRAHELIVKAMQDAQDLCDLDFQEIKDALSKCEKVRAVFDGDNITEELEQLSNLISVADKEQLQKDIHRKAINQEVVTRLEHEEEEEAELEEIEVKRMGAVELMTIVGAKGLSADHVIIIGFDNVNMKWVTKNAFYVALTRARKSLHILTALKSGGATEAHSFLNQLPDNHVEFYSYKKGNHAKRRLNNRQCFVKYLDNINRQSRESRQK